MKAEKFIQTLDKGGINFFTGVPDSLLKSLNTYIDEKCKERHIITANEGNAIAIACGYYMATNKRAAVYMQNSGLGNAINPITSLAHKEVYDIPMLLIVGWRGKEGVKDEPQHKKQGKITLNQLRLLDIPYIVIDKTTNEHELEMWITERENECGITAIVVEKNSFEELTNKQNKKETDKMQRKDALRVIVENLGNEILISTTGVTSRELNEIREERNEETQDFLTVGGMGHALSIALGVAIGKPGRKIVCIDGDGSMLMHLGSMPVATRYMKNKLIHIVVNNNAHESVGGQETGADQINFKALSEAFKYDSYFKVNKLDELKTSLENSRKLKGKILIEVVTKAYHDKNLTRPKKTPTETKRAFINKVKEC